MVRCASLAIAFILSGCGDAADGGAANEALANAAAAPASAAEWKVFLAGRWGRGGDCGARAIEFGADGVVRTSDDPVARRWGIGDKEGQPLLVMRPSSNDSAFLRRIDDQRLRLTSMDRRETAELVRCSTPPRGEG